MSPRRSQTVLVTGAAGFVGRHLCERLEAKGHRVRRLDVREDPAGRDMRLCDINDVAGLSDAVAGCDAVIHAAGTPREEDWATLSKLNVDGAFQVFEAARRGAVRTVIYASSIHVFGLYPADERPFGDAPQRPDSLYGVTKVFGESLLRLFTETGGIERGFSLRLCSVRETPRTARELSTWLSHDDLADLVDGCLQWEDRGYHAVWGVSDNRGGGFYDPMWAPLGYRPQGDASLFKPQLRSSGVDVEAGSEWPLLGGAMADVSMRGGFP